MRLSMLDAFRWRLMCAQIDNRDALEVIRYWDNDKAVFYYIDPPYHPETRSSKNVYPFEPDENHHIQLVDTLLGIRGAAVLSGYNHPVYWRLEENGWLRLDFRTACYAAVRNRNSGLHGEGSALKKVPRVESVWINPKAISMIEGGVEYLRSLSSNDDTRKEDLDDE